MHLEGDLLCEFDSDAETWDEAHEEAIMMEYAEEGIKLTEE